MPARLPMLPLALTALLTAGLVLVTLGLTQASQVRDNQVGAASPLPQQVLIRLQQARPAEAGRPTAELRTGR